MSVLRLRERMGLPKSRCGGKLSNKFLGTELALQKLFPRFIWCWSSLPVQRKVGHNSSCVALFTYVDTVWMVPLGAVPHISSGLSTRTCQGVNPVPGKHMSGHLLLGMPSIPFPFSVIESWLTLRTIIPLLVVHMGQWVCTHSKYSQSIVFHWLQWLVQEWIGD